MKKCIIGIIFAGALVVPSAWGSDKGNQVDEWPATGPVRVAVAEGPTLIATTANAATPAETGRLDVAKTEAQYGVKIESAAKVVTITMGDTLNGEVTDPAKVAAAGFKGTKKGDQLQLTYEGKNSFTVYLSSTGKAGRLILKVLDFD